MSLGECNVGQSVALFQQTVSDAGVADMQVFEDTILSVGYVGHCKVCKCVEWCGS